MPATVRDILLLIRAKEDASRAINKVSASMRNAATTADAASARARAAALRAQAQQARLSGASRDHVVALQQQARAYDDQARSAQRSTQRSKELGGALEGVGTVMQTVGIGMIAGGAAIAYGLKKAVDVAGEWDRQVRLTFTQVDKKFKPSLEELSRIGLRVSRDIAVPFETVQDALFDVFSSTEANMPQAEALLRSFAKAAVAGQTDIQTASRATIGLMNAFKIPFKDVNKLLDIQFQLVQEGVGTYEEWANRIGLVSPSAVRAGQSIEQMAAALSTATRLGMNAARASTSVARAFDAMSNPKTENALKRIGVRTRDAKGNFRPLVDVLGDWRHELEKMPKEDRVKAIIETLKGAGGTIEARRFLQQVLLSKGGLELFQDQVKEFSTDKGAFVSAYNEMAGSISSKTQLLHNAWKQLQQGIGEALLPLFSQLVGAMQKLVGWFNKLPGPTKQTITQFLVWGSVLGVVGGAVTILVGLLVSLAGVITIAGSALLPVVGIMVGVAAGAALLVAGIGALIAAVVIAYQKSAQFRALLGSIAAVFATVWASIKTFAAGVWSAFQTQVLPALKQLWSVIELEVLPAVRQFVDWFRANVGPAMQIVAGFIMSQLKPAFDQISVAIKTQLIPAIQELTAWWNRNRDTIEPFLKILLYVAGAIVGMVIAAILFLMRTLIDLATVTIQVSRWVGQALTFIWHNAVDAFRAVRGAIQTAINAINNFKVTVATAIARSIVIVSELPGKIKRVFVGASVWLINAGADIVQGLINGIRGRVGEAAQAAANLAHSVLSSAMHALGVHSPSTKFKAIGMDVIRGLTEGVKNATTQKQLMTAMYRVTRDVQRSINAADISTAAKRAMMAKWNTRLAGTTAKLNALEGKRVSLQTKLAAAQKSVNDQIAARNDLANKIAEAVSKSADLSTLDDSQKTSSTNMVKALQDRLQSVKTFQQQLRDLAQRGLDKETIAELAQQGVDAAGSLVSTLAHGSTADLKTISKLQQQIRAIAGQTGTNVAGDLYNAGIKAGQGLVKGLQSQLSAITKQMVAIAAALVKAIKKELGIKSPSRVFDRIGVNTARGYINGYVSKINKERDNMANATMFTPNSTRGGYGTDAGNGTTYQRNYDQKITINTQEIDPRKQAAALGWELQGRLP